MKIVVIGSSNIDMIARVNHLPLPGETVGQAHFMQAYGGKGANQAVAAARMGGEVTFVTALGNDIYAELLKENFSKEGIVTDQIIIDSQNPTGTALILVAENAENCIAVAPGANGSLSTSHMEKIAQTLEGADIVVMQAEIPYETIKQVAIIAHRKGIKIMFNPAPACHIDAELMNIIDILVVNENEAQYISNSLIEEGNIDQIAQKLRDAGAKTVIITLGRRGSYLKTESEAYFVPSYPVKAIDTTAAGDVFCGALAVACVNGCISGEALRFASAAAAIAVTRIGAQPSIPVLAEVREFMKQ